MPLIASRARVLHGRGANVPPSSPLDAINGIANQVIDSVAVWRRRGNPATAGEAPRPTAAETRRGMESR
jgi:hypothetical protein